MLIALSIEKFALVDSLYLEFSEGLNILTGETGAGKSIVIHALSLVLGGRASREFVMTGSEQAMVEATFAPTAPQRQELSAQGIDVEDVLSLQRTLKISGAGVCRINGKIVPLSVFKESAELLLEIHGQHENQLLFDKANHMRFLDEYGAATLTKPTEEYRAAYLRYGKLKKKMISDQMNPQLVQQRKELLKTQLDEFAKLKWQAGEEATLTEEVQRLSNFELIAGNVDKTYDALYQDESSVMSQLDSAMAAMGELRELNKSYEEVYQKLSEAYYMLEDVSLTVREMKGGSGFSQQELEEAQKRLFEFAKMKKKYGNGEAEVLQYFAGVKAELHELNDRMEHAAEYKKQLQQYFNEAKQAAQQLSDARKKVAKKLAQELLDQLADLGMEKSQFVVQFTQSKNLSKTGLDEVEFLFSANVGEDVRPMTKVASGGEISRLMLALKNIDLHHSKIDSMVFDEIDTGISGKMAQAVAEKLANIASGSQVLCVTHLPQVAAMSDRHFLIAKSEQGGKTRVQANVLTDAEQVAEIARLVSGKQITESGLAHAQELLDLAREYKSHLS